MAEGAGSGERFLPARYQQPLPLDRLILQHGAPGAGDRMELDVVIVGAGPAGLACAIELAQLAKRGGGELTIGVLEKAAALGEHSLSGAVVNPRPFRELFPDLNDADFPFRGPVTSEAVHLLTAHHARRTPPPPGAPLSAHACPADHAKRGQLYRPAVRDRALAGGEARGARSRTARRY